MIPKKGVQWLSLSLLLLSAVSAQKNKKKEVTEEETSPTKNSTGPPLTGDPQKDYIHDPNLPIELHGYDLSDYPFYKRVPKEGHNFTCDGRLDGFYASVPHKCQVYYNCLFSQRYDFLCANYTVFDQVNFICHYASEVDCKNSERFYDRNEELYVTTSTTTQAPRVIYVDRDRPARPRPRPLNIKRPQRPRPQRPSRRRLRPGPKPQATTTAAPAPDDYYDYYDQNYYDDYDYYDEQPAKTTTTTTTTQRPRRRRPGGQGGPEGGGRRRLRGGQRRRPGGGGRRRTTTTTTEATPDYDYYYDDYYYYDYPEDNKNQNNINKNRVTNNRNRGGPPPAEEVTEAPAQPNRRSRPGQSRRPNFKRSQSNKKVEENSLPDETKAEEPSADEPSSDSQTAPRLISRPIDSEGNTVLNEEVVSTVSVALPPIQNTRESSPQEQNNRRGSTQNARGSSRTRRPNFRRPAQTEVEEEPPSRPQRRPGGAGFGSRRS